MITPEFRMMGRHGWFYCSTGPSVTACYVDEGGQLVVRCSPAKHIYVVANKNVGTGFHAEEDGFRTAVFYQLGSRKGPEQFVRVEVVDERGRTAWTNPLFHPTER